MIVIIEDSAIHQLIAHHVLGHYYEIQIPATPQELLALPNEANLIICDCYMSDDWLRAREAYLDANPSAAVIEWSAGCKVWDPEYTVVRATERLQKTGTGRELLEYVLKHNQYPMKTPPIGERIIEGIAAFLGIAATRA